jgi:hypothetical protein
MLPHLLKVCDDGEAMPNTYLKIACPLLIPANLMVLMDWTVNIALATAQAAQDPNATGTQEPTIGRLLGALAALEDASNLLRILVDSARGSHDHDVWDQMIKQLLPTCPTTATGRRLNNFHKQTTVYPGILLMLCFERRPAAMAAL